MRLLARAIAVFLVISGAMLGGAPEASARAYGDLILTPSPSCPGQYCSITFETWVFYNEHGSIDGSLVNADTGIAEAGLVMPYSVSARTTLAHALPAGRYILTVHQTIRGHWSCSIYDPNACSWRDPVDQTKAWKFVYSGSGALTVPPWNQVPFSAWVKGKLGWSNYVNIHINGRVLVRIEQPDFTLGPWRGSGNRTVLVQVRRHGPWRTIHKGTTKANGKYSLRFKFKDKRVQRWRIVVPAENGLPPGSKRFPGWN